MGSDDESRTDQVPFEGPADGVVHASPNVAAPSYIVGIGASAGGLEALERFFQNAPLDTGWAFVVVQHLSPDFKSLMDELLARRTKLPIHRVEDGMAVAPNSVYLIPAQKNMVLSGGRLLLTDQDKTDALKLPIDMFFRSLAQDCGPRAIGIVLSGTGSDGSRGVRELHQAGGLVVVQDKQSAAFDGMPRSAADTGLADIIDSPERMPSRILRFLQDPSTAAAEADEPPDPENEFSVIFGLLRGRTHVDFSVYKPSTVGRRIDRRISLSGSDNLEHYIKKLHDDPAEIDALYRDILVEVTSFFRDPPAFQLLEQEVVPALIDQAGTREELRVWVPGCATGQEAYSLAMLLRECARQRKRAIDVKVFASDVHQQSLDVGGAGVYDERSVAGVPGPLLDRYFHREGEKYTVTQELRQMVIFAPHDVTRDPPFTKLDLISCRNLLIYLLPAAQRKVLSLFHFALKTGGILMLGPSESVADLEAEFETLDSRWRIYRKRRDVRLLDAAKLSSVPGVSGALARRRNGGLSSESDAWAIPPAYEALLAEYVPSSLLLSDRREIVHSFGNARRYFQLPEGRSSLDVLKLTTGELRTALSSGLHRAEKEGAPVVYRGVTCETIDGVHSLKITVKPLPNKKTKTTYWLVCLEQLDTLPNLTTPEELFDAHEHQVARISTLEEELNRTKEHLQSTIEELETSNEELQSTNEELVASNEELQSTNEELHSVNEELYTVNAEYQRKIEELTRLSNDMQNLLRSTEIGTVFLDRRLNIRRFTPAAAKTFNFLPRDVGRPIAHIAHSIPLAEGEKLVDLIRQVLKSGRRMEREIRNSTGSPLLMRIQPYVTERDTTEGAVLTFVDIAVVKETEEKLQQVNEELERRVRQRTGEVVSVNEELARSLGREREQSERLRDLANAAVAISGCGSFTDTLETVSASARRILRVPWASASFVPDGDWTRHMHAASVSDQHPELRGRLRQFEASGIYSLVCDRNQAQRLAGDELAQQLRETGGGDALSWNPPLRDWLAVPLIGLSGENLGLVQVSDRERGDFTADDEAMLQQLARVAAAALEIRRARESLEQAVQERTVELRRANSHLRDQNEELRQFTHIASHDLQAPLRTMRSFSDLLEGELVGGLGPKPAEYLQRIRTGASRMQMLIDDLLALSRVARGELQRTRFPLDECVDQAIAALEQQVGATGAQLTRAELPVVHADRTLLTQVYQNLLDNALKFVHEHPPNIQVTVESIDGVQVFGVRDNGIGIEAEYFDRVLEPFKRLHSNDRFEGTGIGLAICQKAIQRHGGRLWIESQPGRGSHFRFTIE